MSSRWWSWLFAATLIPAPLAGQQAVDTLQQALAARAARSNPQLLATRAAIRTLESRVPEAAARSAPTLSLEVDEVPGGVELWNAGQLQLSIEQELFTGRRRSLESAVAQSALTQQRIELQLLERGITVAITRDLTRWIGERQIVARIELEDALLLEVERSLTARFSVGDARYVDVLRVRTERLRAQSELSQGRAAAERALSRLVAVAGDTTGLGDAFASAEKSAALPAHPAAPPSVDSLLTELQTTGLLSLGSSSADARAERDRAGRSPRIAGAAGVQRFGSPDDYTVGPALRVSVSLPFAVARSNRNVRLAAENLQKQGAAEDAARRQEIRTQLLAAERRFTRASEQVQLFDAALLSGARSERDAVLVSYRTGSVTLLELLDFERALARAEIEHVRARLVAWDAWADLLSPVEWFGAVRPEGDDHE